jgi:hypothetical protein|tara:strand:+ start:951 stop:1169 length:219 start_codon:yes stop_codon:yes gene_type:complete
MNLHSKILPTLSNIDDTPYYDWSIIKEYRFWRPYQGKVYKRGDYMLSRGVPINVYFVFIIVTYLRRRYPFLK